MTTARVRRSVPSASSRAPLAGPPTPGRPGRVRPRSGSRCRTPASNQTARDSPAARLPTSWSRPERRDAESIRIATTARTTRQAAVVEANRSVIRRRVRRSRATAGDVSVRFTPRRPGGSRPAHGRDRVGRTEPSAHLPDQHVDHIRHRLARLVPAALDQLAAGDHLARAQHEQFEHRELLRGEAEQHPGAGHPASGRSSSRSPVRRTDGRAGCSLRHNALTRTISSAKANGLTR